AKLAAAGLSPPEIQAKVGLLIKQQASILSLNDAFLAAGYLSIGLSILVWFAHPTHLPLSQTLAEELREMRAEELIEEVP
ncbi:MAG: MFS transporter, partial [Nitrospiraceae bacterium]